MTDHEHLHHETGARGSFWTSRGAFVLVAFLAMGGTLLFTEHRAHVLGFLPWLFILACPLMHVFMRGGHGGHGGHGGGHAGHGRLSDQSGPDSRGSTGTWDASKGAES